MAALDRMGYGFDRAVDHEFWRGGTKLSVWERNGEPVAYSYTGPDGHIGPLAAIDAAAAAAALRAELARATQCWVEIPGTSRSLVDVALEAGLRISPPPGLLLLAASIEPPRNVAISDYFLF